MSEIPTVPGSGLRVFTKVVAAATFVLLLAGAMVTSTGSGLAVPDWPLSFGQWMPPMEGGVLYEHGHRMIASFVGLLIVIEAVWLARVDPRPAVRALGWAALGGVVVQGLLGGLTVLLRLPDLVSVSHAALAELVFGATVALAVVCSRSWATAPGDPPADPGVPSLFALGAVVAAVIWLQIVLGAVVRHTGAGLVIPDFPLAYGEIVPPLASTPVALHFAHRVGAVVVLVAVAWVAVRTWRAHGGRVALVAPASLLAALVVVQIGLGGWTVLSRKAAWVTSAHLGVGALLWATALVLAMNARRHLRLAPPPVGEPERPHVDLAAPGAS